MLAETAAALSSLKAASDIARAIVDARDGAKLTSQIAELQQAIISAQVQAIGIAEKNLALSSRVQELEDRCKRLTDWSAEAESYEVREVAAGVFAYMKKGDTTPLKSAQKLCAHCFQKREKSLLQQSHEEMRQIGLNCHACMSKVVIHHYLQQT